MSLVNLVVFEVEKEFNEMCWILKECTGEDPESGGQVFDVTSLSGARYFEFAKLPKYEPTLRVRIAPKQIWAENKENLPFYISESLKDKGIPYKISKKRDMNVEEFAVDDPKPIRLLSEDIEFEYQGY